MENTILILCIVTLVIVLILTFFIFQVWIQSKDTKIQLSNIFQELQKGLQTIESINAENKLILNSLDQVREKIKSVELEILNNLEKHTQNSDQKILNDLETLKIRTNSIIEGLSENIKLFKENIESRIKELDSNLSHKLVSDLTYLINTYSKSVTSEQTKVLEQFERTSIEIQKMQNNILNEIKEPLKINQD
jgi:DNA anti-recombination protein RmuC